MTDKYSQVMTVIGTYKTISEISDALGWEKGTTQHYCKRLEDLGYVEKTVKHVHGHPFMFRRLIETLPAEHLENLHNRKCLHRTQIMPNKAEVNAIYNRYLFGNISAPINEGRAVEEKHPYSEKKKSPRVYVGCSFGLVGW